MEILLQLVNIFLHLDEVLTDVVAHYQQLTYLLLFLVIFMETGLVVTPFLPGDSLIFAAGALAAVPGSPLNVGVLFVLLCFAAILGDTVNYWIGHYIGPRAFSGKVPFLKKEYMDKTHAFYEKHGGKAIILARFVPIVRTFAPFVGGVGAMTYSKFILYNVVGGILWVALFIFVGFFFGNIPFIQKNFEFVIIAIILISAVPMAYEYIKAQLEKRKAASPEEAA
jgi:membrane-associated protein